MDEREIILRKDAKAQRLKRYYTGNLCKHGHMTERLTSNGTCLECLRLRNWPDKRARRASVPAVAERHRQVSRRSKRKRYAEDPELRARVRVETSLRKATKLKAIPLRAYRGHTDRERQELMDIHHWAIDSGSFGVREYVTDTYWYRLLDWEAERQQMSEVTGVTQSTDHRVALANNGEHHPANFDMMPLPSNCSKGTTLVEDWVPPENVYESVMLLDEHPDRIEEDELC